MVRGRQVVSDLDGGGAERVRGQPLGGDELQGLVAVVVDGRDEIRSPGGAGRSS